MTNEQAVSTHPMRGPRWDAAEARYRDLLTAFDVYQQTINACDVKADSVIGMHMDKLRYHLGHARP